MCRFKSWPRTKANPQLSQTCGRGWLPEAEGDEISACSNGGWVDDTGISLRRCVDDREDTEERLD